MTDTSADSFRLDQPQPNDIVGDPLLLAGSGGGFEATIDVRILDGNGQILVETSVTSTNLISPWRARVDLPASLSTTQGVVEVGPSTGGDESPARVSVPVFFGTEIARGFRSYFLYTVQPGDTLSSIAQDQAPLYIGDGFGPILQANRHIISDPDLIYPGMVLRLVSNF
jgi:nucleoid-associated protein YgaU